MNRLQKKCILASAGAHLLLLLLIMVGPAFVLSRTSRTENYPIINIIPMKTTDLPIAGGGNPEASPLPPAPKPTPTPPVAPPPKEIVKPEPVARETKPLPAPKQIERERPRSVVPDVAPTKPKSRLPEVSTNVMVVRNDAKAARERAAKAAEIAAAQLQERQRAGAISSAISSLRSGRSGALDLNVGPGGGGPSFANFNQALISTYYNAWEPPSSIANENAITKASVTVERDGTVLNAYITVPSGDAAVDASVNRTLQRVKWVAPLPDGATEKSRTIPVIFDLKAKREN